MKKKEMIETYRALAKCKLTGMSKKGKDSVLGFLRVARPVEEAFEADVNDLKERLKPEGFEQMERKVREHNEAVERNTAAGRLRMAEFHALKERMDPYYKELDERLSAILNEDVDFKIAKLTGSDFDKFTEANDIEVERLATVMVAFT